MKKHINILLIMSATLLVACNAGKNKFDASGTFETQETIVSSCMPIPTNQSLKN